MFQTDIATSNSTRGTLTAGYATNAAQLPKTPTLMDEAIEGLRNNNVELTETSNRIQCALERILGGWPEEDEEKGNALNGSGRVSDFQEGLSRFTQNNQRLRDLASRLERIA